MIGRLVTPEALDRIYQGLGSGGPLPSPPKKPGAPSSNVVPRSISPAGCRSAAVR